MTGSARRDMPRRGRRPGACLALGVTGATWLLTAMLGAAPETFYGQSAHDQGYLNAVGIPTANFGSGEQAFAHTGAVIAKVSPGDLHAETPCADWDVRALVNHTVGVVARDGRRLCGVTVGGRRRH